MRYRVFLIFYAFCLLASCGTAKHLPKDDLADRVWAYGKAHNQGFTLNLNSMTEPAEGICVAYAQTQSSHGREGLEKAIDHAAKHNGYVGGWYDRSDSLYYFDSVRLFPEDSLEAAGNFGKANLQKSVYRLSDAREIPLKEDLEFVSPTNLIIMYDPQVGKEALLEAAKSYGVEILYDYSIIPGIAIRIPDGSDIIKAIEYFADVKGVTAVERDHIYHLTDPVKPRLEVM